MAPFYLILALVIQCSFIHAEKDVPEDVEELQEALQKADGNDEESKDLPSIPLEKNWLDMFGLPNNNLFATPSASMMAQVTNSNKSPEEQLKDIKEICQEICHAMETEMINLFSYAMANSEKEIDDNGVRRRRSAETPMDSTEMVMRLLKHIKSNNEYQNIAIDKMMSTQEIAEKFGIEFSPDPEILSDLAMAASDHAQEMTNMLKDACTLKNVTTEKVEFIPVVNEPKRENDTYFMYGVHPEDTIGETYGPSYEYMPDIISPKPPVNHLHFSDPFPSYTYPYESQINSPPVHHHSAPVTPKPTFYDPYLFPFTPVSDYYNPYCSVEPIMSTILVPMEDPEPEPELVGEEVEETITSKMIVEKGDEPGTTSVNHVTTYTISEKSHFKPPQIEQLPQHFQYCFFLI